MNRIAHFMDFEFSTENSTFYPRPETEILVEKAVELLRKENMSCNILDIGTGCGNIAISLAIYDISCKIVALDIHDTALYVAKNNAIKYGVEHRIEFIKSDLFVNLADKHSDYFDMIISNPPYISLQDFYSLSEDVKQDPYISLYGGIDGMDVCRIIISEAHKYLKKNGVLLIEMGYDQSDVLRKEIDESGFFTATEIYKDYSGIDRILMARRHESDERVFEE